jgi:hypothetical protein
MILQGLAQGDGMTKLGTVFTGVGSTLVALAFIGLGLVELLDPAALGAFATWGYAERFRLLLAAVEIGGGCLLLVPRVARYSAAFLGTLLAAALSTRLWNGQVQPLAPYVLLLAGLGLVGYARHPRTFVLARLRAVADAVADREIAQEDRRLAASRRPRKGLKATSARTRPAGREAAATNSAARSFEA